MITIKEFTDRFDVYTELGHLVGTIDEYGYNQLVGTLKPHELAYILDKIDMFNNRPKYTTKLCDGSNSVIFSRDGIVFAEAYHVGRLIQYVFNSDTSIILKEDIEYVHKQIEKVEKLFNK